jgi:REP element-mobilizing transposase RayT
MPYNDLRRGRYSEPSREYLITAVVNNRAPVLADFLAARLLIHVMREMELRGDLRWLAWVIMPDHLHGLVALGGNGELSRQVGRLKAASAARINRVRGVTGRFWQPGFHDRALRREDDRCAVARYIVANPLRRGLVTRIGDYPHWDSVWL